MKPKIFVSHISEEAELAIALKSQIETDFLYMVDMFISSDGESIGAGSKWLRSVEEALNDAQLEIIICSKASVNRPWINFEAGAGWIKEIPIVPICHTDMTPESLPVPLNMLQAIIIHDPKGIERLYRLISDTIGCSMPNADFNIIASRFSQIQSVATKKLVKPRNLLTELLLQVFIEYPNDPNRNRFASGVLFGKNVVFTAAHLIEDNTAVMSVSKNKADWHKVTISWDGLKTGWDLVVGVTEGDIVEVDLDTHDLILCDEPHSCSWYGASFAEAGNSDTGRTPVPMSGTTCPIVADETEFYVDVQSGPTDIKKWKGVSGAPIIVENRLIGTVSKTSQVFDGRRLCAVPMWKLVTLKGFKEAIGM